MHHPMNLLSGFRIEGVSVFQLWKEKQKIYIYIIKIIKKNSAFELLLNEESKKK